MATKMMFLNPADVYLIRTDAQGNTLWEKNLGNAFYYSSSVRRTADGGFVLAGETKITDTSGLGYHDLDVYLVRTDAQGNKLWKGNIGTDVGSATMDDCAYDVQLTSDGGFVLAGYGDLDALMIRTDAQGNSLYGKRPSVAKATIVLMQFNRRRTAALCWWAIPLLR